MTAEGRERARPTVVDLLSDTEGGTPPDSAPTRASSLRGGIIPLRDQGRGQTHDDLCESEFITGPMAYSPCGCAERAPRLHHPDCPMTNERPKARTACVCHHYVSDPPEPHEMDDWLPEPATARERP